MKLLNLEVNFVVWKKNYDFNKSDIPFRIFKAAYPRVKKVCQIKPIPIFS